MKNKEFISYANSFQAVPNLGLNRISNLLDKAGNPQNILKFIHIAGTNGKGSVCSFLQSILTSAGLKVGKFTSPNMLLVNERISVDGVQIGDQALEIMLIEMKKLSEQTFLDIGETPSQFEIWTAVALAYFKEQKCDMVILETGLGGRFDATNVIGTPIMSIITRIDLDHTALLGDTIAKIAFEKAGIIKPNGTTLTIHQEKEALDTILEVAKCQNNDVIIGDYPTIHEPTSIYECFSYKQFDNIVCGLGGLHQIENAILAIECTMYLNIPNEHIIYGIRNAKNIGRFEMISKDPIVIFDGAHNPSGITALTKSLERYYKDAKKTFIIAFMGDKDIKQILDIMKNTNAQKFYFTKVQDNERALSGDSLYNIAKELGIDGEACSDVKTALEKNYLRLQATESEFAKNSSLLNQQAENLSGKKSGVRHAIPSNSAENPSSISEQKVCNSALHKKNNGEITVICGSLYLYKDLF